VRHTRQRLDSDHGEAEHDQQYNTHRHAMTEKFAGGELLRFTGNAIGRRADQRHEEHADGDLWTHTRR
jgi:hypothetical protein